MPPPSHAYSPQRLRRVVILLTLATLPVVFGASTLIYYYLRYSVMVERRLQGERFLVPSRIYARPLQLRPGQPADTARLAKVLNGLNYEQRWDIPLQPGQFAMGNTAVVFHPRHGTGAPEETLVLTLEKDRIKDIRGTDSKKVYPAITLEPELISYLFDATREKKRMVRYGELPDHLIKAVLAIEDRRFFTHPGLDPFRIIGAALRNWQADSYIQGGSTITQQLCKNFFLSPEKSFRRKAQEAVLAFVLERRATKEEILELYLNEIYLGQVGSFAIHGVGEASRMYFHKGVGNLTLTESALLAGMIQSPNPYNPYRHGQKALDRRNVVLRAMVESGFLERPTAEAAMAQPLKVEKPSVDTVDAPYFVDLVKAQLAERYPKTDLTNQNLNIFTTLDLSLQAAAQNALRSGLERIDAQLRKRNKNAQPVQGALIAFEVSTGNVVALVGGRSYEASQYNRVMQARRQLGSTFKPFVYLAAFEAAFDNPSLPPLTPATVVDDSPGVFFFGSQEYIPQNYEGDYRGPVTLRRALASSLNVATVKVAEMVGYDKVANVWSRKLAISDNVKPYPALALGSFEATPYELATAYNVLANYGTRVDPATVLRVSDEKGGTVVEPQSKRRRVVRPESAFLVVHMMRSVLNAGTALPARQMGFTADAAGKTGTTNDMRDAWFGGFTPEILCIVWVGRDDNTPIGLSGGRAALPIWVDFMKAATAGRPEAKFTVPAGRITFVDIDPQTGFVATPYCPKTFPEAFVSGTEPQAACPQHSGGYVPYDDAPGAAPPPPLEDEEREEFDGRP